MKFEDTKAAMDHLVGEQEEMKAEIKSLMRELENRKTQPTAEQLNSTVSFVDLLMSERQERIVFEQHVKEKLGNVQNLASTLTAWLKSSQGPGMTEVIDKVCHDLEDIRVALFDILPVVGRHEDAINVLASTVTSHDVAIAKARKQREVIIQEIKKYGTYNTNINSTFAAQCGALEQDAGKHNEISSVNPKIPDDHFEGYVAALIGAVMAEFRYLSPRVQRPTPSSSPFNTQPTVAFRTPQVCYQGPVQP